MRFSNIVQDKIGVALVAQEKFSEPREVEVILLNSLLFQFIACLCLFLERTVTKFVMLCIFYILSESCDYPYEKGAWSCIQGQPKDGS